MDNITFTEESAESFKLYEAYYSFLEKKKDELGKDSEEFISFKPLFTDDFQRGLVKGKTDKKIIIQSERLIIREASIEDSDFMSYVERDKDNAPWVANWPLGWRVAKFGDEDFLQVIVELKSGTPIGFIIFRDMLQKEKRIQLKRIAIMDKEKGYGKETYEKNRKEL